MSRNRKTCLIGKKVLLFSKAKTQVEADANHSKKTQTYLFFVKREQITYRVVGKSVYYHDKYIGDFPKENNNNNTADEKKKSKKPPHFSEIMAAVIIKYQDEDDNSTVPHPLDPYAEGSFRKRIKCEQRDGRWYVVMFARRRDCEDENVAADGSRPKTCIKCTPHIGSIFISGRNLYEPLSSSGKRLTTVAAVSSSIFEPKRHYGRRGGGGTNTANGRRTQLRHTDGHAQWQIVLALGPINIESEANTICELWSKSPRSVICKTATGEALAISLDIGGYVDWNSVFPSCTPSAASLFSVYDVVFRKNPCSLLSLSCMQRTTAEDGDLPGKRRHYFKKTTTRKI